MPKGSEALTNARREEIIAACRSLYERKSFREITLKEIGELTSFTRTSIYNYFETKEEIFLALLQKEYEAWSDDLQNLDKDGGGLSYPRLAEELSRTLERRSLMLKLMSMNHFDMEANSRLERLVEFKRAYGASIDALDGCLRRSLPDMSERSRSHFIYAFLPFVFGLFPYTVVTEKQREAMEKAGVSFQYMSISEMVRSCALMLLEGAKEK